MRRTLGPLTVTAAVALGLAGCATTTTYSCGNDSCEVTLKGAGAETELFDDTVPVRLDSADGQRAQLTVDDRSLSCTAGETVSSGGLSITCDHVGDDEVTLSVDL